MSIIMSNEQTRRRFGATVAAAGCWSVFANSAPGLTAQSSDKPALMGGKPVRTQPFPSWPRLGPTADKEWADVLHKGKWCRLNENANYARRFEETWAKQLGARYCLATSSGTTALFTCLSALDVGPGDEVIVPPYTFVATVNVVFLCFALPVFVDSDRETFQIDAKKIEAAITPRTKAIIPVHFGGSPADMDAILRIGARHKIPVLEDACQAHLGEWRSKKLSTLGAAGCFSFQASKNLNSGEGGAIITNDEELSRRCGSFHNNGRARGTYGGSSYVQNGSNHRMTEFQAAILCEQLTRLEEQSRTREENARYLTGRLKEIPGIAPARLYEGCTRSAYHCCMFRYDPDRFAGLPRDKLLKALRAEGIPAGSGYAPLNKEPFIESTVSSTRFRKCFSDTELARYRERIRCPENDKLCQEAVLFSQTMLLGTKSDMDQIAEAVLKIRNHAGELVKT